MSLLEKKEPRPIKETISIVKNVFILIISLTLFIIVVAWGGNSAFRWLKLK